ncbi:MAG: acetylxylan esterase [Luteitalea sp.]|nr:acetylxylan esterase [Luteitalea sp.]
MPQNGGWQADPDIVKKREQERPKYLWQETDVPPYQLPDLLRTSAGTSVTTPKAWPQRREEILELFRNSMYGHRPGAPEQLSFQVVEEDSSAMNGAATLRRVAIHSAHEDRTHQFEVVLFLPNESREPVPVFLLLNNRRPENTDPTRQQQSGFWPAEEAIERGYGIAAIQNNDLAPDDQEHYSEGVIRLFEGEAAAGERDPDAWGALAAWGWGASRVMDYFETDSDVDTSKVALLGHSRGGKAALWAGAEDERFALVISNESGCGGAALSRRRYGETVRAVNRFPHWFNANFKTFNDREDELPFDQHMLLALIAPRAVYVASADEDLWADPRGEFRSLAHASPVYALYNHAPILPSDMPSLNRPLVAGNRGYHIRNGAHNLLKVDWQYLMDFADRLWHSKEEDMVDEM